MTTSLQATEIQWVEIDNGKLNCVDQKVLDKFQNELRENPVECVFDLEESAIEVNKYARADHYLDKIVYFEVDSRHNLSAA